MGTMTSTHQQSSPPESISPRAYRQTATNEIILDMIEHDGIDVSADERLISILRRRLSACQGEGWSDAADELTDRLRAGDLAALRDMLTIPSERNYHYLTLNPLISRYCTPEIRDRVRRDVPRTAVRYG